MSSSRPRDPGPGSGPLPVAGSAPGAARASAHDGRRAIELLASVHHGRIAMSVRALPYLAVARHLVIGGRVVLRMHRGLGFHDSCDGSVVAYGADNFDDTTPGGEDRWSVQFTGPAEIMRPTVGQRELFGAGPSEVDGERFDPVYLRVDPQLVHMHTLSYSASP